jgi:uncharacterized phage protein (TIGR02220 family)
MPIFKKKDYDDKITKLTNEFLQNKDISLEAKGLLGYMLSLPQNWKFTIEGIANQTGASTKKIIKLLHELEEFGYHTKVHYYENGRIKEWIYYTFAEPRQDIINKTFDITSFELDCTNQQCRNQDCCFVGDKQTISNKLDIETKTKVTNIEYNVEKEKISKNDLILKENIKCIIDYLNESIGANYKYNTKGTINLIKARFNEGYKLDDFYDVIDKKVNDWIGTEFEQYLRPTTLFGNKFENYLNSKIFKGKPKSRYSSKPTFDNTAGNVKIYHISDAEFNKLTFDEKLKEMEKFDAVADMTQLQKEFHDEYCLARDKDGNLLKF